MTIKITQSTQTEVEIKLPYFAKQGNQIFYKIVSDKHCILVDTSENNMAIQKAHAPMPFNVKAIECTEQEFNEAYHETWIKINELNNLKTN